MRPAGAIHLYLFPSRRLATLSLAAHLIAATSIILANLPTFIGIFLMVMVGASVARQRSIVLPKALILYSEGKLEKVGTSGTVRGVLNVLTARLGPLVVLLFKEDGSMSSITLLPDSVQDSAAWHRLQLWLRWQALPN